MNNRPRRPAQLDDEQIEYLTGEPDPSAMSDLAHASAGAFVEVVSPHAPEEDVIKRVRQLAEREGIDVIAESWVRAPEDTLPGILWRGYLLREWIRREPNEVAIRFNAAKEAASIIEGDIVSPHQIEEGWNLVFGIGHENFSRLLAMSASLLEFLATVEPVWIADDEHDLAHEVTRRSDALKTTSDEFKAGAVAFSEGRLF